MKCDEVRENLAALLDGEIEGAPRRAVDEHLAGCAACAGERRDLAAAWRLLDLVEAPPAPAGFDARLRARIAAGHGGAPGGRLLRLPLPAAAAAAALLVAAGVYGLWPPGDGARAPGGSPDAPPAPVLEELALLESLDLLQAAEGEALDRLDDFGEEDLAVLGG